MHIHTCKLVAFRQNSPFWIKICHLCESSRSEEVFLVVGVGVGGLGGEREREREKVQARRQECVRPKSLSRFDLKQQCAERSLYDIKAPRELQRADGSTLRNSNHSRGTLMSSSTEPVRFDSTLTLSSACKHVVGVEVLHCEWSRHKVHNL